MFRCLLLPLVATFLFVSTNSSPGSDDPKPTQIAPEVAKLIQGSAGDFIKRFDKNGDGYLTKDELPPRLAALFDKMDANGDGKLDKKEVTVMLQVLRKRLGVAAGTTDKKPAAQPDFDRMVANLLERMDTNKDGKISKEEARGPLANNFDRFDTNKDGYLDRSELRQAAKQFLAAQRAGPAKENPRAGPKFDDFDALDRNADGRLTRAELKDTPYEAVFDQIDTNKDGKIDKKEFETYLQKQAERKKDS